MVAVTLAALCSERVQRTIFPAAAVLLAVSIGCAPASRSAVAPLPASAERPEDALVLEPPPPPPDPVQERDDAVLLGTLIGGTPRVAYSVASLGTGIATLATSGTFAAFAGAYLARGGSFGNAVGPMLFGVGGTGLGVYQLASGGDFARIQLDLGLAVNRGATPAMILAEFEPRLRDASYRATSRRRWFAGSNLVLAGLSIAAGSFLVAARPEQLQSSAYPSVLFGLGAINGLAGLMSLIQPSPVETAWESYVHLTSR